MSNTVKATVVAAVQVEAPESPTMDPATAERLSTVDKTLEELLEFNRQTAERLNQITKALGASYPELAELPHLQPIQAADSGQPPKLPQHD